MAQTSEPSVDFSTFLVSLAGSALASLGQVDGPSGGSPDLALARHTIALVELLAAKTKGNLDPDEEALLQTIQRELNEKFAAAKG